MKILCVFGKYQYGKKERGLSTEYFSFVPAMERLGHEVVFFDSWDRSLYRDFIELNKALIDTIQKVNPDIIFSVQLGYEIWLETWDYIRANFKCKTVNWCTDDSWKYKEHSKFLAPHFDLMVTTYEEFLPKYKDQGCNAILSNWATPIQWIKEPKKIQNCKYSVTFIGAAHGNRKKNIENLKKMGVEVECFGHGWKNGAIDAEEIPIIFNESAISLNFANSKGENQIKARVFEVTGSGGFLMTQNAKNLEKIFSQEEIVIFDTLEDLKKKIEYYLQNTNLRDDMVRKSFEKCKKNYTYSNRLNNIINHVIRLPKKNTKKIDFNKVSKSHKTTFPLKILKKILVTIGKFLFGTERGKRFARRLVYELSWRISKERTYSSKGIVGRMFYEE